MSDDKVTVEKASPVSQFWRIKGRIFNDVNKQFDCAVLYSKPELTELRDEIDRLLPRYLPEPKGSYAQVVYGDSVEVNENVLDGLLMGGVQNDQWSPLKDYLIERGVVLT